MLVWESASRLPTTIESAASADQDVRPDALLRRERDETDPSQRRQASGLGAGGQECRDWGAGALIGVRRPGMKRHRRDLEGEPHGHQRHAREQERVLPQAALEHRRGDARKVGGARDTVGEADPVEKQRRCEGAQQEVLDGAPRSRQDRSRVIPTRMYEHSVISSSPR